MRLLSLFCLLLILSSLESQHILLDESYEDWAPIATSIEDTGDSNGIDIEKLAITNDQDAIYLYLKLNQEILLQEQNRLTAIIEFEKGVLEFIFGEREGTLFTTNSQNQIYHNDIGLIISPSVSSREFELMINRTFMSGVTRFDLGGAIRVYVEDKRFGGDVVPNVGVYNYEIDEAQLSDAPTFNTEKRLDSDFRLCSYNVLRDGLFDSDKRSAFASILKSIDADIFLFQEIYDHTALTTQIRLTNSLFVLDSDDEWYSAKEGPDIVLVSRYPIIHHEEIARNGAFVINKAGHDILIINVHLACCENNRQREEEIDAILSYIRQSKAGLTNYQLLPYTPIIIAGDMNFVGGSDQVTALLEGKIFDNAEFGPDVTLDWDNNGLTDLQPFTTGRKAMYTWISEYSSYSAGRLDYVFYSDHSLIPLNSYVLDTEGLTEEEQDQNNLFLQASSQASDHLPIVVDFKFSPVVAANDLLAAQLSIYPNPAREYLIINTGLEQQLTYEIFSQEGIRMTKGNEKRINISRFEPALYFIQVYIGNETLSKKFLVH